MPDFSRRVTYWQRTMATAPQEYRGEIYGRAATDLAGLVADGSDRPLAVDVLTEIADAHNLPSEWAQEIIAKAMAAKPAKPVSNGKQRSIPFLTIGQFVAGFITIEYLIVGMLQRRFVYALTGATGHAKTAIALLIAELVGNSDGNSMLGPHKVKKGKVVYFAGENPDDLRMRVIGAASKRGDDAMQDRVWFIPGVFNIVEMYALLAEHINTVGGVDLVIVDTSAAYFLGQDENANPQIGAHARMLRRLTELPGGPCVLVLCHPIKHAQEPAQLMPRGGGAFLAEMDGNLTVWREDNMITLHHTKIRGPDFEALTFTLDRIDTPKMTDSEGRLIPTVRAVPISQTDEDRQKDKAREDEDRVLVALLGNPDASMAEIAEKWNWTFANGGLARSRVQRAIERIDRHAHPKLLRKNRDKWELTEEGKTIARKAALAIRQQEETAGQSAFDLDSSKHGPH